MWGMVGIRMGRTGGCWVAHLPILSTTVRVWNGHNFIISFNILSSKGIQGMSHPGMNSVTATLLYSLWYGMQPCLLST